MRLYGTIIWDISETTGGDNKIREHSFIQEHTRAYRNIREHIQEHTYKSKFVYLHCTSSLLHVYIYVGMYACICLESPVYHQLLSKHVFEYHKPCTVGFLHDYVAQHNTEYRIIQQNKEQRNISKHNTAQDIAIRYNTPHQNKTQCNTTQHNKAEHNTIQKKSTQPNKTHHITTRPTTTTHNTSHHYEIQQITIKHKITHPNKAQHNTLQHKTT